jgi:hypothetical protein
MPLVAIGKAQGWARSETLLVTGLAGVAHAGSTILIGIVAGLLGYKLSADYSSITSVIAPAVLIGLGLVYLILDMAAGHNHQHRFVSEDQEKKVSRFSVVMSLCVAMFFSPCLEIEAYYFTAGFLGWKGIIAVSVIYLIVTVLGMVILVDLGLKGIERIRSHFLEHHEMKVTGFVLVALGTVTYFVKL